MVIRCFFIGILLSYVGLNTTVCQKEDSIWLFGSSAIDTLVLGYQFGNTVMDFSDIEPLIYYDSLITMDFAGTNASICDKEGNLLIYSNGMEVHDSGHMPIENGDTIAYSNLWKCWFIEDFFENGDDWISGLPVIQGTLILPLGYNNEEFIILYHIVPKGEVYVSSLNYSLISKQNDSNYILQKKDEIIKSDQFNLGQMNACRHANGRDWWLIQQNEEADSVFTYLISRDGIELQAKFKKEAREEVSITSSQVAFSPNGELYAVAGQYLDEIGGELGTVLRVFSFDRCEGELIELGTDTLDNFGIRGVVAFSPSGQFIYTSSHEEIFQYNMYEEDWVGSKKLIATYDGFIFQYTEYSSEYKSRFGPMALAPDGRIYSVPNGSNRFLNVIDYPDEEGEAAEVNQHKIMMPTENFSSTPNFPNYRMGPLEGSTCDTLGLTNHLEAQFRYAEDTTNYLNVRFTDISYFEPEEWYWDFGDGTTYEGKKPYYHEYAEAGVYHVCLTVSRGTDTDKYCKTIYLGVTSSEDKFLNKDQVKVYPNPVEDYVNIEIRDYIPKDLKITIYNSIGEIVLRQKIRSGWNQLEFHEMAKGVYHYILVDAIGNTYSDSFIKI